MMSCLYKQNIPWSRSWQLNKAVLEGSCAVSLALSVPAFLPQDRAAALHKKDSTGHHLALHRKRLLTPHLKHEKFMTGNSLEVRW